MANTWTTLLDAVYPTGSLYFSTNSTSPASKFGGTWSQIQDAFIAAKGSSYITGTVAAYSGNKAMTVEQMPKHNHQVDNWDWIARWGNNSSEIAAQTYSGSGYTFRSNSDFTLGNLTNVSEGGGQTSLLTTILRTFGAELPKSHCSEGSDE